MSWASVGVESRVAISHLFRLDSFVVGPQRFEITADPIVQGHV